MDSGELQLDTEEAAERRFWGRALRVSLTGLIPLATAGLLWAFTAGFAWERYLSLSLIGVLAGIAVAVATLGSRRMRAITGLVVGGVVLPIIATHLAGVAARDPAEFTAMAAGLIPFLVSASGALAAVLLVVALWPRREPTATSPVPPIASTGAASGEGAAS